MTHDAGAGAVTSARVGTSREPSLWPAVLLATLVGVIVRAAPVGSASFPINDGGLFASFVDSILAGPDLIPANIDYNSLGGPFAYPPLAFLATAGLQWLFPIGTVEWLRWLPLAASIATVPAFFLLAREAAPGRLHAIVATFAFALVPRSFEWMIMGGGLSRAPGFLLAILAIWLGLRFLRGGGRSWLGAGIALGLAVLTHPAAALFAGVSLALATIFLARSRRAWIRMTGTALAGLLVAAPWLVLMSARYGIEPFLSAGGVSANPVQSAFALITASVTDEPFWKLAAGLGVLGFVYLLFARRFFVPVWVVVLVFADPRAGATFVSVPLSLLVAVGLLDLVVARLGRVADGLEAPSEWSTAPWRRRSIRAVMGLTLVVGMVSSLLAPYILDPMSSLSADQRSAMAWSRESLPSATRAVVVTGRSWYEDATSEWFPYLTGQTSVATVQGYEWMGSSAWRRQLELADDLAGVSRETAASIEAWAGAWGIEFDVVYVPKGSLGAVLSPTDCCPALRTTLAESGDYEIVYDGPGATIARRVRP